MCVECGKFLGLIWSWVFERGVLDTQSSAQMHEGGFSRCDAGAPGTRDEDTSGP